MPQTILIVDDEPDLREILMLELETIPCWRPEMEKKRAHVLKENCQISYSST